VRRRPPVGDSDPVLHAAGAGRDRGSVRRRTSLKYVAIDRTPDPVANRMLLIVLAVTTGVVSEKLPSRNRDESRAAAGRGLLWKCLV